MTTRIRVWESGVYGGWRMHCPTCDVTDHRDAWEAAYETAIGHASLTHPRSTNA